MATEVFWISFLTSSLKKNPYSAKRRIGHGLFYFSVAVSAADFTDFANGQGHGYKRVAGASYEYHAGGPALRCGRGLQRSFIRKIDMIYNELGKTGMRLSNLGFGASSLGGVFHDIREAEGIRAVHVAVENGINFIDVSPYYGYLKAEQVLGKALRDIPRGQYYLSTKVGRYGKDGHNHWDYSGRRAKESVYESMERLGVDYIDIINVHDVEFADLHQVVGETLPALVELREEGVVRHVGITDLQPENLKWVIEHAAPGTVESVLSFCHYCLNDELLTEYLDFFEANGVGVINASPFSMGLLSQRGAPDWHPAPQSLKDACRKAAEYCAAHDYPIEKLALQYSTALNPRIATTLFSSANPQNVLKNIEYVNAPYDAALAQAVQEIIGDQMRVRWKNT